MYFETRSDGYERFRERCDGKRLAVYVHQLVAIREGCDPENVFSGGRSHVHHRNGIKWDNRPVNLELVDRDVHSSAHAKARSRAGGND